MKYSRRKFLASSAKAVGEAFSARVIQIFTMSTISKGQDAGLSIHAEAVPFTPTIYLNLSF